MKKMKWNEMDVLKVINTVVNNNSVEYSEINSYLGEYFGLTPNAVVCSRISIMRILQGFDPSSKKGDLKGYNFGSTFIDTVNKWYDTQYGGQTSRYALSYKFYG